MRVGEEPGPLVSVHLIVYPIAPGTDVHTTSICPAELKAAVTVWEWHSVLAVSIRSAVV